MERERIDLHAVRKSLHAHELLGVLAINAALSRHLRVRLSHRFLSLSLLRCCSLDERQNLEGCDVSCSEDGKSTLALVSRGSPKIRGGLSISKGKRRREGEGGRPRSRRLRTRDGDRNGGNGKLEARARRRGDREKTGLLFHGSHDVPLGRGEAKELYTSTLCE